MRSPIIQGHDIGVVVGRMARGCRLCFEGSKAVIFVTGLCDDSCFYCPVSRGRMGRDVIYVDEEPVENMLDDVYEEIYRMDASGASITGGDPLVVPRRTLHLIEALKNEFGNAFHIHLYTSGRYATRGILGELEAAGLDEIRFHPTLPWFVERVRLAVEHTSMDVGVEVPALPGAAEALKRLASMLEEMDADFLNINELEVSESNQEALAMRGYKPLPNGRSAAGSRETALEVVAWASENLERLSVRFCPALYKDAVQTRNRLRRKARGEARPYEAYTPEGTLVRAEIPIPRSMLEKARKMASKGLGALLGHVFATHPDIAEEAAHLLGSVARLAEYHPTTSRLLVASEALQAPRGHGAK